MGRSPYIPALAALYATSFLLGAATEARAQTCCGAGMAPCTINLCANSWDVPEPGFTTSGPPGNCNPGWSNALCYAACYFNTTASPVGVPWTQVSVKLVTAATGTVAGFPGDKTDQMCSVNCGDLTNGIAVQDGITMGCPCASGTTYWCQGSYLDSSGNIRCQERRYCEGALMQPERVVA